MGDHMIGSLNSTDNVCNALNAGVTTIGNISHYFSYEYAGFDMELERTIDACTAIGIMGELREKGTIIHSNLDDGFGGQLHDVANLVGWARLERYFVEDLLGGGMNHCFGNLFSDPILRIIFSKAMWEINTFKTPGSMIYGNTTDFGGNFPSNYSALASFTMADIIGPAQVAHRLRRDRYSRHRGHPRPLRPGDHRRAHVHEDHYGEGRVLCQVH